MLTSVMDTQPAKFRLHSYIYIYMAEFLHCSPEITTTLFTDYISIQNKEFKVTKKKKKETLHDQWPGFSSTNCLRKGKKKWGCRGNI